MLQTYEAIYHQGQLHWLDPPPQADQPLRLTIVVSPQIEGETILVQPFPPIMEEEDEERDPTLRTFLSWLDQEMVKHPERIQPLDEAQLKRIAELIEGVEVD